MVRIDRRASLGGVTLQRLLAHVADAVDNHGSTTERIDDLVMEDSQWRISIVPVSVLETARVLKDVTECLDQLMSEAMARSRSGKNSSVIRCAS